MSLSPLIFWIWLPVDGRLLSRVLYCKHSGHNTCHLIEVTGVCLNWGAGVCVSFQLGLTPALCLISPVFPWIGLPVSILQPHWTQWTEPISECSGRWMKYWLDQIECSAKVCMPQLVVEFFVVQHFPSLEIFLDRKSSANFVVFGHLFVYALLFLHFILLTPIYGLVCFEVFVSGDRLGCYHVTGPNFLSVSSKCSHMNI